MGVDVNLYAEVEVTPEQLQAADQYFQVRSAIGWRGEDGTVLVYESDPRLFERPRVEVSTACRYYGPGYERGDWPAIYGAIRVLMAAFPGAKVYYGGDSTDDGQPCTARMLAEIWRHFLGPDGDAYRGRVR